MSIRIERDLTQPMRQLIHVRNHLLPADAGIELGGLDAAPSPHDLYDAALGACISLTVLWHARRRQIPVGAIDVRIERDASQERHGVYRLEAFVSLGGELSAEQHDELMATAGKCPVHKLMTEVTTEITTIAARSAL